MPPLKSFPDVLHVTSQEEFDSQFNRFESGEISYVRARGLQTGETFQTFVATGTPPEKVAMGLMLDGISVEPMHCEYFADLETYQEKNAFNNLMEYAEPVGLKRHAGWLIKRLRRG